MCFLISRWNIYFCRPVNRRISRPVKSRAPVNRRAPVNHRAPVSRRSSVSLNQTNAAG